MVLPRYPRPLLCAALPRLGRHCGEGELDDGPELAGGVRHEVRVKNQGRWSAALQHFLLTCGPRQGVMSCTVDADHGRHKSIG
jgi:hypothetical protein